MDVCSMGESPAWAALTMLAPARSLYCAVQQPSKREGRGRPSFGRRRVRDMNRKLRRIGGARAYHDAVQDVRVCEGAVVNLARRNRDFRAHLETRLGQLGLVKIDQFLISAGCGEVGGIKIGRA